MSTFTGFMNHDGFLYKKNLNEVRNLIESMLYASYDDVVTSLGATG